MSRVLIVEDEVHLARGLRFNLEAEGHTVEAVGDGESALELLLGTGATAKAKNNARREFDAVVLDVMLPGKDGFTVASELRAAKNFVPVLMLTARGEVDDRVAGLDAGADDYLVKPFALRELLARLRALLRRAGGEDEPEEILVFEDLRMDLRAHEAWRGERMLALTRTEFLLLEMFMRHARQVLTRSAIFEHVWGYDFGSSSNSLGVYMGYLRRKTEVGEELRLLHTVRGVGYVLRSRP